MLPFSIDEPSQHMQPVPISSARSWTACPDALAEQLELSRAHPKLVPMVRQGDAYVIDPRAASWQRLPAERGFAGFGLERALRMLSDVLLGLEALHQTYLSSGARFAHGDIAPHYFRLDPLGVCRLVPLTTRHSAGWAAALSDSALGYLSPERHIGEPIGVRADVFSVGVLLWEALAGRRLFDERDAEAIFKRMMNTPLQPPTVPAHFPWAAALESHALRALQINQWRRQESCEEIAQAIRHVAHAHLPGHDELARSLTSAGQAGASPPATPAEVGRATAVSERVAARQPGLAEAPRRSSPPPLPFRVPRNPEACAATPVTPVTRVDSPSNALGWAALVVGLVMTVTALVFASGRATSATRARAAQRHSPPNVAVNVPVGVTSVRATPTASAVLPNESDTDTVQRDPVPDCGASTRTQRPTHWANPRAARRDLSSAAPGTGSAAARDYGI